MAHNAADKPSPRGKGEKPGSETDPTLRKSGGSWWSRNRDALYVQIVGALIAALAGYWLGKYSAETARSNDSQEAVDQKSRLPDIPLGSFLGAFLVTAGSEEAELEQSFEGSGISVESGSFVVSQSQRVAVVSSVSVTGNGKRPLFTWLEPAALGSYSVFENYELNCGFRADVVAPEELFVKKQYLLTIESWTLNAAKDRQPCKYTF